MKTPEEIKQGLECCYEGIDCTKCPYMNACFEDDEKPYGLVVPDALAYIQQLERERDAAVADLNEAKDCTNCKNECNCKSANYDCKNCNVADCPCKACRYEWRGAKEE